MIILGQEAIPNPNVNEGMIQQFTAQINDHIGIVAAAMGPQGGVMPNALAVRMQTERIQALKALTAQREQMEAKKMKMEAAADAALTWMRDNSGSVIWAIIDSFAGQQDML